MDLLTANYVDTALIQINQNVLRGPTDRTFKKIKDYLDSQFRLSVTPVSELIEYIGIRKLTPREEYASNLSSVRFYYDVTRSDFTKVAVEFKYLGEPLNTRYIYIPFSEDGTTFRISNTRYHIADVLTDPVISIEGQSVFVKVHKDKINFERMFRQILVNRRLKEGEIIFARSLFRNKLSTVPKNKTSKKAIPPIALYLFTKYGLERTFKKYCGFNKNEWELTRRKIPEPERKNFTVVESIGEEPTGYEGFGYFNHNTKILLPIDCSNTALGFATAIIYLFDYFPDVAKDLIEVKTSIKEKEYWELLMVRLMFPDTHSVGKASLEISKHIDALDEYLNPMLTRILTFMDVKVDTFFDLCVVLIDRTSNWIVSKREAKEQPFTRYFETLYYILFDYIVAINQIVLEIGKKSEAGQLSFKEVNNIFNTRLKAKKLYTLNSCLACIVVESTTDHRYLKIASTAEFQQRGNGVKKGKNGTIPYQFRTASGEGALIGSLLFLTKAVPSSYKKINIFACIDPDTGRLIPTDEQREKVRKLDIQLAGRVSEDVLIKEVLPDVEDLQNED